MRIIYQPHYQRRLDWAKKHLDRLEAEERRWREGRPCRVWTKFDLKRSQKLIWAEVLKQPPSDFALILGDCLHNLRSSLDNLAFELLLAHKKGRPSKSMVNNSGFPIHLRETEDSLKEFKRMTRGIHPDAQALIKRLQPYNRGNQKSSLLNLSKLNNTDKHRIPHVAVVPTPETLTFVTTDPFAAISEAQGNWGPMEGRAIIGWYPMSREHYTEVDVQYPATFRIGFGERAPDVLQGWWVVPTVKRIHDFISLDIAPELIRYLA